MRHFIAIAAASTLLAGCAAGMGGNTEGAMGGNMEGGAPMGANMPMDMPEDRTAFTKMAASSDLFEIQSSQLAMTRAQNPAVRQFAQMMIRDHTSMSQQLMAAAQAAGVPPMTPQLLPMHADMLARLNSAGSGMAFDNAYARAQVMAHEMALALHGNYASDGDTASLRAVSSAAVPVIQQHLNMARQWPVR